MMNSKYVTKTNYELYSKIAAARKLSWRRELSSGDVYIKESVEKLLDIYAQDLDYSGRAPNKGRKFFSEQEHSLKNILDLQHFCQILGREKNLYPGQEQSFLMLRFGLLQEFKKEYQNYMIRHRRMEATLIDNKIVQLEKVLKDLDSVPYSVSSSLSFNKSDATREEMKNLKAGLKNDLKGLKAAFDANYSKKIEKNGKVKYITRENKLLPSSKDKTFSIFLTLSMSAEAHLKDAAKFFNITSMSKIPESPKLITEQKPGKHKP